MARSEARILVEIWDDDDFIALSPTAQRMFLFLISQRDLEHTGVLGLRERRWAKRAAGLDAAAIARDLAELEAARFVVVDEDSEELLIRSFIRRDKVFRQPNVMRSAVDRVAMISSRRICEELSVELQRIAETEPMTDAAGAVVEDMREALAKASPSASRNPAVEGSDNPSRNPSDNPSQEGSGGGTEHRPGDWGVVTTVGTDSPSTNPQASGDATGDADEAATDSGAEAARKVPAKDGKLPSTHPKLTWSDKEIDADPQFQAFWKSYPKKDDKGHARKCWLAALRKHKDLTAVHLVDRAQMYRDDPRRSSGYTKNPGTWLNAEGWANYDHDVEEPPSLIPGPRPFYEN